MWSSIVPGPQPKCWTNRAARFLAAAWRWVRKLSDPSSPSAAQTGSRKSPLDVWTSDETPLDRSFFPSSASSQHLHAQKLPRAVSKLGLGCPGTTRTPHRLDFTSIQMITGRFKLHHLSRIRICKNDITMHAPTGLCDVSRPGPTTDWQTVSPRTAVRRATLGTTSYDRPYSTTCRLRLIVSAHFLSQWYVPLPSKPFGLAGAPGHEAGKRLLKMCRHDV